MRKIALCLALFLSACGSSEVDDASAIIKQTLKKPESFTLKKGDVIWQGKLKSKQTAFIVKVKYTAMNGFNDVINECKYVSFYTEDGSNHWQENGGLENCIAAGGKEEENALVMLRKINSFN
ncbi:hypothetical protein HA050_19380 [Iodobacter sp. HSC-16F04]|uniref:Lipoprotein n=1 Tax=Iodobacter violaceini TaxID=3044271 RepID=A0ABX0KU97_9NEIS|nr:hypothetical protein [Iodobacter violacea]NHQ88270.1 hypothetical protein [Iodobacter violacea]